MAQDDRHQIHELLTQYNSVEEFLRDFDTPRRKHEIFSALDGEGRIYVKESDHDFTELDTLFVGVGLKLYEYLHIEPPE